MKKFALCFVLLFASKVFASTGTPADLVCPEQGVPINGVLDFYSCVFPKNSSKYGPPGFDYAYKVGFNVPHDLTREHAYPVLMRWGGYGDATNCPTWDFALQDTIVVNNCPDYSPTEAAHRVGNIDPLGWGGQYFGDSNAWRFTTALDKIAQRWGKSVNWSAGIAFEGQSYGAATAMFQVLMFGDVNPWWQRVITKVRATMTPLGVFDRDSDPSDGVDDSGLYWRNPFLRFAWGDYDIRKADHEIQHKKLRFVYFSITGASNDAIAFFHNSWFQKVCDGKKVSCRGMWHDRDHSAPPPEIKLPWDTMFDSVDQDVRLSDPFVIVFTESTANNFGPIGHYNLGWRWNNSGFATTRDTLVAPIGYLRTTDIYPGVADQPPKASVNVTVRLRSKSKFKLKPGDSIAWVFGNQTGNAVVTEKGEVTIPLTRRSANVYTNLVLSRNKGMPASNLTSLQGSIVYTRLPRAVTPVGAFADAANWQHASDVGRINGGIAEADVVIDDTRGNIKVIHNCTNSPEICVAQEARVSPDGTRIVYSVGYGYVLEPVFDFGIEEIPELTHAQLFIYDLKTGKSSPIPNHPDGAIDRQPEWLDNETLVFASNRQNVWPFRAQMSQHEDPTRCGNPPYCVSQEYGYSSAGKSMQIWRMKIDGTDARNLSPHENMALAPAVMSNGDILYSCWNAQENKFVGTPKNHWWLCRTDGNGADETSILNAHKSALLKTTGWLTNTTGGEGADQLRAVRSVAEIFKGKLAITSYYRGNHLGSMGIIYALDYMDPHIEGCSTANCYEDGGYPSSVPGTGRYTPSSIKAVTPYGQAQDMDVRFETVAPFRPLGKAGYPAPLPNTGTDFLITHARGQCYEVTEAYQTQQAWLHGEPSCQKAIYKVKVPMVTNPFDKNQMEQVSQAGDWQAWDARAIAPYSDFYGQAAPARPDPLTGDKCYLQVVDARKAELSPANPYNWIENLTEQCAFQGCAVNTENPNYHASNIAALRILQPKFFDFSYVGNQQRYVETRNTWGYQSIEVWGEKPLEADGSLRMEVPCETPILMAGVNKAGLSIAHDSMLHSLRKGETRTCHGCHEGHSEEQAARIGKSAIDRFPGTLAAKTNTPIHVIQNTITWRDDIKPIVEKRCASCHKPNKPEYEYSAWVWDDAQIDFPGMARQPTINGNFLLTRPYTSKYVAKFALDSLMYWKCMGSRRDGRSDAQYNNDIDFGPAHAAGATPLECGMIGLWIDTGMQF